MSSCPALVLSQYSSIALPSHLRLAPPEGVSAWTPGANKHLLLVAMYVVYDAARLVVCFGALLCSLELGLGKTWKDFERLVESNCA